MSDTTYQIDESFFGLTELRALLRWAVERSVSDVTIQTGRPVYCDLYGQTMSVTNRPIEHHEMEALVREVLSSDAMSRLNQGKDIDTALTVPTAVRDEGYRFRVNATQGQEGSTEVIQITLRSIPKDPPQLATLDIEPAIIDNFFPKQGLVVVGGPTGSGKTTLLAALMRASAVEMGHSFKLNTYESPIEFDLTKYSGPKCLIHQVQIERNLPSFAAGTRNSMRRAPKRILIGEARDGETMAGVIECSNTGHATYTTTHASTVQGSVRRLVSAFDGVDKGVRIVELIDNLHLIVNQILVPSIDGKRCALREYLLFDGNVRRQLLDQDRERIHIAAAEMAARYGQTMQVAAERAFKDGKIAEKTLKDIRLAYRQKTPESEGSHVAQ